MFNREVRLPVDIMYGNDPNSQNTCACPVEYVEWVKNAMTDAYASVRGNIQKGAERQRCYYNVHTKLRVFRPGDWVWVFYPPKNKEKFGRGWLAPYLVMKKLGDVNYAVQKDPNSRPITLHVDHMKAYNHDDTPDSWLVGPQAGVGVQVDM